MIIDGLIMGLGLLAALVTASLPPSMHTVWNTPNTPRHITPFGLALLSTHMLRLYSDHTPIREYGALGAYSP